MFVYFTFCYIFQTHYFFHTTIDYIESSVQTVDTVSDILKDEFQKYSLHVIGREDTEVTISAKDVSLKVDTQDALQKIMDSQNGFGLCQSGKSIPMIWSILDSIMKMH